MRNLLTLSLLAPLLGLGGCYQLSGQQGALLTTALEVGVSDLCVYAGRQYDKLGNPTSLQVLAKAHVDSACADPATTAALMVNTYNQFAKTINAPLATTVAATPAGGG